MNVSTKLLLNTLHNKKFYIYFLTKLFSDIMKANTIVFVSNCWFYTKFPSF